MNNDSILHLIAISFALGLAYAALDRFRYYNTAKNRLVRTITEVRERIKEKNPALLDTAITSLEKKLKEIKDNGLGPKLFFKIGAFGGENKFGWDTYVIYLLMFIQYGLLLCNCWISERSNIRLSYFMLAMAAIGPVIPLFFILLGNRKNHMIELFISKVLEDVSDVYKIPIKEMYDNLDKNVGNNET